MTLYRVAKAALMMAALIALTAGGYMARPRRRIFPASRSA